jgi:hypothetical protein
MDYRHYISHVPHGGKIKDEKHQLVFDIHILPRIENYCIQKNLDYKPEDLIREITIQEFKEFVFHKLYPNVTTIKPASEIKNFLKFHYEEYCSQNEDQGDFALFIKYCIRLSNYLEKEDPLAFRWKNKTDCEGEILEWLNNIHNLEIKKESKKDKDPDVLPVPGWALYYHYLLNKGLYKSFEDGKLYSELTACPGGRMAEVERIALNHDHSAKSFNNAFSTANKASWRTDRSESQQNLLRNVIKKLWLKSEHEKARKAAENDLKTAQGLHDIKK